MRLTNFYAYEIGGFSFRVRKSRHGNWTAQVQMRDDRKWASVRFPDGIQVIRGTKKALVKYLRYAYLGEEL